MRRRFASTRKWGLRGMAAAVVVLLLAGVVWAQASVEGDLDGNGRVDLEDWGLFEACRYATQDVNEAACLVADLDGDGDVDAADGRLLGGLFTDPGQLRGNSGPRLNEVGFVRPAGEAQFVELLIGHGGAVLAGSQLSTEDQHYTLPEDAPVVEEGDIILILFDGAGFVEGHTIHADQDDFLDPNSDALHLHEAVTGEVVDVVRWGADRAGAVSLGRGGAIGDPVAGMTLGRRPQALGDASGNWLAYAPAEATPGHANPLPGVAVLRPSSGVLFEPNEPVDLSWYPVPDAQSYRVQIATDADFTDMVRDEMVAGSVLDLQPMNEGSFYWRVQALYPGDRVSTFSASQVLFIRSFGETSSAEIRLQANASTVWTSTIKKLKDVPSLSQRKDTDMILLESDRRDEGHRYDAPHPVFDPDDKADVMNCALASIAMINRFFGGGLSQDRIGYQMYRDQAPGAEKDLNYNYGLDGSQIQSALQFALGGAFVPLVPIFTSVEKEEERKIVWQDLTRAIDRGHPALVVDPSHAMVLVGYELHVSAAETQQVMIVHDPWYPKRATARERRIVLDFSGLEYYFVVPPNVVIKNVPADEPAIGLDTDSDGINDFDEVYRFGTDWQGAGYHAGWDTDRDCIKDKEEIEGSMFDPKHGYALWVNGTSQSDGTARDSAPYDNRDADDTLRPERDNDSDNGGLPDFMEDLNRDGRINVRQGESNPFDPSDDLRKITGTIKVQRDQPEETTHILQSWEITVDLQTDSQGLVSGMASSTYNERHILQLQAAPPQCPNPRTRQTIVDEIKGTVFVEGTFGCIPGMSGTQAPSLTIMEPRPQIGVTKPGVTFKDPCHGDSRGSVNGTIFHFRDTFVGSDQGAGFEFNSTRNRVQWKYRAPIRTGRPLFTDYDIVMTPQ